ncbi:MAG TPA: ABC transporter transmembrane domain-containing protein [Candidatus Limiplasma sp.]|nr:ABC transporter transmembrane domain-containing protein [Candidatus Limiplasma sp.]
MHNMHRGKQPSGAVAAELRKPRRAILLRIGKYLLKFKWLLLVAFGLTLVSNTFALIGPTLAGKAIDSIGTQQGGVDMPGVLHYALLMAIFYLASSIFAYLLSVLMVYISRNVTRTMRKDLFSRIAEMPVGFFDTHPVGDVLSRIFYDVDTINTSLSSDVVQVLTSVITIVGSLVLMISISPVLVLVFLVTVPMSVFITRFITRRTQPCSASARARWAS